MRFLKYPASEALAKSPEEAAWALMQRIMGSWPMGWLRADSGDIVADEHADGRLSHARFSWRLRAAVSNACRRISLRVISATAAVDLGRRHSGLRGPAHAIRA